MYEAAGLTSNGVQPLAKPLRCPACGAAAGDVGERLPVDAQHAAYFPDDPALCQALSRELASVTDAYALVKCAACGLTFAAPMASPGGRWYDLAYGGLDVKGEYRWEYDVVLGAATKDDRVFELGCGGGVFLRACRKRGIEARGTDFSQRAVDACRTAGLNATVADEAAALRVDGPPATVVGAFHVLEHLPQPEDVFRQAAAVSGPSATLWVSVPSDRRFARVHGQREPLDEPPHHLTQWTEAAFTAIAERCGWRLESVQREPFSWRAALWSSTSRWRVYKGLANQGWLRRPVVERSLRALLYPAAFLRILTDSRRASTSGFSMLARFRRVPPRTA